MCLGVEYFSFLRLIFNVGIQFLRPMGHQQIYAYIPYRVEILILFLVGLIKIKNSFNVNGNN